MQTTGTVLLNARGCNINGYDCFVNLSKDTNKYPSPFNAYHAPSIPTPVGTNPYYGVSNSYIKFSSNSLVVSDYHYYSIGIYTGSTPSTYTISTWQRDDPVKPYNDSLTQYQKEHYRSKGIQLFSSFYYFFDNTLRNSWNINVEFYLSNKTYSRTSTTKRWSDANWHHFAVVNSNGRHLAFVDGIKVFDQTASGYNIGNFLRLNMVASTLYCDDLVVIANQALWTSNFTPPSTYLLDSEYAMDLDQVKRRNIIAANVDKKLIIPDDDTFKQY